MRTLVLVALAAAAAACDWTPSEPIALRIEFIPEHTLNEAGECVVQFRAVASGAGTAQWEGVTIRDGQTVIDQRDEAGAAVFWGSSSISAGQAQESEPFTTEAGSTDVTIQVFYSTTGPTRSTTLGVQCPSP